MLEHEDYQQLCAAAAAGDISDVEWDVLQAHLTECVECREVFRDLTQLHAQWLPQHERFEIRRSDQRESELRRNVLRRLAGAGARFSDQAVGEEPQAAPKAFPVPWPVARMSLAAAALLVFSLIGVWSWTHLRETHLRGTEGQPTVKVAMSASVPVHSIPTTSTAAREQSPPQPRPSDGQASQLISLQAEKTQLERQWQDANTQLNMLRQSGRQSAQQAAELAQQLAAMRATVANVEAQLAAATSAESKTETELAEARNEIHELNDKLADQAAALNRERELMAAGREIRDLIAARNLHIIDVYDTNGSGKTNKVFGRVFYTEGKSLVFYAYDLASHPAPTMKYAYYAWGKLDESQSKVRNLGMFYSDDQTHKRWVLKVTDPRVLSEIDSVFVTLEPAGKPGQQPSGKKLLSAYLGTQANHP